MHAVFIYGALSHVSCSLFMGIIPRVVYAISRAKLKPIHFEGSHNIEEVNAHFRYPIEIIYAKEFKNEALKVIEEWENTLDT